jgi:hypothetical protein
LFLRYIGAYLPDYRGPTQKMKWNISYDWIKPPHQIMFCIFVVYLVMLSVTQIK